jgi:hypothetical protein
MKTAIRAARDHEAQERIKAAVRQLAEKHGLALPQLTFQRGTPQERAMKQRESIADFLLELAEVEPEAEIVEVEPVLDLDALLEIDGIGPKTLEQIKEKLGGDPN